MYGSVYDNIITLANVFTPNTWQHIVVTYDSGTTGNDPNDLADYYSRFNIYLDGAAASKVSVNSNQGYTGAISGENVSDNIYRVGRASNVHNNYLEGKINQVAIWGSDESANVSAIYNAGVKHDMSLLASAPAHYYEVGTSVTTLADETGSVPLTGFNFISSDLVTDAP